MSLCPAANRGFGMYRTLTTRRRNTMETTRGIDYGMGKTNVDRETGIRYGVISQHSVLQAWAESAEADYGVPTCPKCGNTAKDIGDADLPDIDKWECDGGADYACEHCQYVFDSAEAFGDEPNGYTLDDGEYQATDCLDSDVMILKAPYYTFAQYCSPCVPGAGNLDCAVGDEVGKAVVWAGDRNELG